MQNTMLVQAKIRTLFNRIIITALYENHTGEQT